MKLLIVFVSVLVLVAQGKVISPDDGDRVYVVEQEPEQGSEYAVEAVQEVGGVEPQKIFALAGEDPDAKVFNAEQQPQEQQRGFQVEEAAVPQFALPESVYLPIISRSCTNSACLYICNLLGFKNGICVSTSTCQCSN